MAKVGAARTIYQSLLAIVGPVDSVNLWKTVFREGLEGLMDCASAQTGPGSLAFLSATPLKTANPPTPSFQNLSVLRSTIADLEVFSPLTRG